MISPGSRAAGRRPSARCSMPKSDRPLSVPLDLESPVAALWRRSNKCRQTGVDAVWHRVRGWLLDTSSRRGALQWRFRFDT